MRLFRITHRDFTLPLDGEGARLYGGRWNPKGIPMLYCASTLSLAALELRAHVPAAGLGQRRHAIEIDIPDDVVHDLDFAKYPSDWKAEPAPDSTKQVGKHWMETKLGLGLRVRSTIIQKEFNVLINPLHPEFSRVTHVQTTAFQFDTRLAR